MNPKRLAVICDKLDRRDPAGAQAIALANGLAEVGHPVGVLARTAYEPDLDGRVDQRVAAIASRFPTLNLIRYRRWLKQALADEPYGHAVSLLSTVPAEVIVPVNGTVRSGLRAIVELQSSTAGRLMQRLLNLRPGALMSLRYERRSLSSPAVRGFVALSPQVEEQLRAQLTNPGVPAERARGVICNRRIDAARAGELRRQLARAWGLTGREAWIVLPFMDPYLFGLEPMLRAFKPLVEQGVDAVLLLAGPTRYTHLAWIKDLGVRGRVKLVGKTGRPEELMAACDLIVSPSGYDPAGWGVMPALDTGKPIVTTDACGLSEEVRGRGGTVLTSPADPAGLLKAIRERLGKQEKGEETPEPAAADPHLRSLVRVVEDLIRA